MAGYITVSLESDPDVLIASALDALLANRPGFVSKEAHLETWLLEIASRMNAETRYLASLVPDSIFRYFGESLVDVPPVEAAPAVTVSDWVMINTDGYTIPEGTVVAFQVAGDQLVPFVTAAEVVIPPGQDTAVGVQLEAVESGEDANDLAPGVMVLVDSLAYVSSVTSTAATAGGIDAETDAVYLGRLRDEMRLLTPRFILATDAAVLARRIAGVHRALGIDNYDPGVNEVQRVEVVNADGGDFTLDFEGQTTGAIAAAALDSDVQTALEALSNIAVGDVLVVGGPLGTAPIDVTFIGDLAASNRTEMTAVSSLTGVGAAVNITTPTGGVAPSSGNERMITVAVVDIDGAALSTGIKNEVQVYLDSLREINFIVHVIDPTYTPVAVDFTVVASTDYELDDVVTRTEAAVAAYLDPANWAGGDQTPPTWDSDASVVRYLEVAQVLNEVDGVRYITLLEINAGVADVVIDGAAPLPSVGAIVGVAEYA